jgi:hypothetical protein
VGVAPAFDTGCAFPTFGIAKPDATNMCEHPDWHRPFVVRSDNMFGILAIPSHPHCLAHVLLAPGA